MTKLAKIALAAGGTGGHLFPAAALAAELQALGHEVHLLTDQRGLSYTQGLKAWGARKSPQALSLAKVC